MGKKISTGSSLRFYFIRSESQVNNEMIMELGKSLEPLVKLKRLALVFDG